MLYEVSSRRVVIDKKGNDRYLTEHFLVKDKELFADAEVAVMELYNGENDVVAIKRSSILDVINKRTDDEQLIYLATFEQVELIDGVEKSSKYKAILFSDSWENANSIALDNAKANMIDTALVGIKKSKFTDLI